MPLTIEDELSSARIAPELGGMVLAWWSRRGADVLHWLWPVPDELIGRTSTPKGGLFVLAPFSNRIEGARLPFRGRTHAIEPNPEVGTDAQHGYASRCAWTIAAAASDEVELVLPSFGEAWPWRLRLAQRIAIRDGALEMTLGAVSEDAEPMPIGLGFHPFFTRTGGQVLRVNARDGYTTDRFSRPLERRDTGAAAERPLVAELDPLGIGRFLGGWGGSAAVEFPSLGAAVHIQADPTLLPYLLLFCPERRPFVCVEPVSHLSGAFELPEPEASAQGLRILGPGERIEASLRLTPVLEL